MQSASLDTISFDLDRLSYMEKAALFDVVAGAPLLIGYNIGIDLHWLLKTTKSRPGRILDAKMLVENCNPGLLLEPYRRAAKSATERFTAEQALRRADRLTEDGRTPKLNLLAVSMGNASLSSEYSNPQTWSVSQLSPSHLSYCSQAVQVSMTAMGFLFSDASIETWPVRADSTASWYQPFEVAMVRVTEASHRGIPFTLDAARALTAESRSELKSSATVLGIFPEFTPWLDQLGSEEQVNREVDQALIAHVRSDGVTLGTAPSGEDKTSQEELLIAGCSHLPFWPAWSWNKEARQTASAVARYERFATPAELLHPLITWSTATGRTAAREPSVQNMPKAPEFRRVVRARPGRAILSLDFSAIELRIGAALAIRSAKEVARLISGELKEGEEERIGWLLPALRDIESCSDDTVFSTQPDDETSEEALARIKRGLRVAASRVVHHGQTSMAAVFRSGQDPHLMMALDLARRAGKISFPGSTLDWLKAQSRGEQDLLKKEYSAQRSAAKACNFGLLYGMSAHTLHQRGIVEHGLSWSLEEAKLARETWFNLYPDLRLWQLWTFYLRRHRFSARQIMIWNRQSGKLETPRQARTSIYVVSTLSNRRFHVLDDKRRALAYQNQGTGADILARSLMLLPSDVADMFVLPVHDELVFEVPATDIERVAAIVRAAMIRAGADVLKARVPVEVEVSSGPTWGG